MKAKKYTFEELLNISTEEFNEWKGLTLHILKKDGKEFTNILLNLQLASVSSPAELVSGFIFTDNTSIPLQSIEIITIL